MADTTAELTADSGHPILWRESYAIGGHTYTGEVTQHWYAGAGDIPGRYRWTVYFENEHRPIAAKGVRSDVAAAARELEHWAAEFRITVAGQS